MGRLPDSPPRSSCDRGRPGPRGYPDRRHVGPRDRASRAPARASRARVPHRRGTGQPPDRRVGLQPIVDDYLAHLGGPRLVNRWALPDSPPPGLRRTIVCHQFGISAMAIAKDGSWVATAGTPPGEILLADTTVRIWNVASGILRTAMTGHEGPVFAMALSPDGTQMATGGDDSTVRVWDVATGSERVALRGHEGGVSAVAFSPDGTWLVTGEYFGPVRIWDVATGRTKAILNCEPSESSCVVLAPDGTWLRHGHWRRQGANLGPCYSSGTSRPRRPTPGSRPQCASRPTGPGWRAPATAAPYGFGTCQRVRHAESVPATPIPWQSWRARPTAGG